MSERRKLADFKILAEHFFRIPSGEGVDCTVPNHFVLPLSTVVYFTGFRGVFTVVPLHTAVKEERLD